MEDIVKQATKIVELKQARDDGGEVAEFICQVFGSNIEEQNQAIMRLAREEPGFRTRLIKSCKEDWDIWMKEHLIPYQESSEGKRYSLAHIIEEYDILPEKFCEYFGQQYNALTDPERTYYLTIEEMWARDIYSMDLEKLAKA